MTSLLTSGPLLSEFATSEESYNGRPDFTEIGFQEQSILRAGLPPSLDPARTAVKVASENPTRNSCPSEFATSTEENSEGKQSSPGTPTHAVRTDPPHRATDSPTPARRSTTEPALFVFRPNEINETSSGVAEEVPMPSTAPGPSNSPRMTDQSSDQHTAKPIVTTSASLPFLGEGCDPSSLLTFDPDSIEPAAPKTGEEPNLGTVDGPLQRLKVLLSSPVDTLVEDPETIRGILVDIQSRLPGAKLGRQ
ncbi:hypothetical protein QYE76_007698 [Lolium multiflorum]|uniref:Uncharacterized protein n=1 Tax=Lolium multiflorum TaxID=4521 RepID=A0AAD8QHE3_LOLMU|nr:hypothetical protein QYE76_007698 [Lolium multiflorum]